MLKSITKIIINAIIIFIIAYTYMYLTENLHVVEEPFFKLIVTTFIFSNMIMVGLKVFFEKNNNIDIDMD